MARIMTLKRLNKGISSKNILQGLRLRQGLLPWTLGLCRDSFLPANKRPPPPAPQAESMWEFPKIRGTILGVPIIRTIVFWGLYWGPPI